MIAIQPQAVQPQGIFGADPGLRVRLILVTQQL